MSFITGRIEKFLSLLLPCRPTIALAVKYPIAEPKNISEVQ
jgi:hypothetical protein